MVRSPLPLIAIPLLAAAVFSAVAQNSQGDNSAKNRSSGGGANDFKFEVLSIKPVRPDGTQVGIRLPTPNGFTATVNFNQLVEFAYGPSLPFGNSEIFLTEIRNLPSWAGDYVYVFDARVSQTDLKAWQSQGKGVDLLRSALRAALTERFKLAIHKEPAQRSMCELVVAKGGPRLKPAASGNILPAGVKLDSGGVNAPIDPSGFGGWDFHSATMADLAERLTTIPDECDGPVRDRTGLAGRYDFQTPRSVTVVGARPYVSYSVSQLGLEFKPGKESRPIVVIDHVERPTPN